MIDVFLICPVRNATDEQKRRMNDYINGLERSGKTVYYPARDTDQNDNIGYRICNDNREAIRQAKEVHIFWDKYSNGSLFDLGMAFAMNKELIIANIEELEISDGKSFSKMIEHWSSDKELNNIKKPKKDKHESFCANCSNTLIHTRKAHIFCIYCGQAIDWSE